MLKLLDIIYRVSTVVIISHKTDYFTYTLCLARAVQLDAKENYK